MFEFGFQKRDQERERKTGIADESEYLLLCSLQLERSG